MKLYDNDAYREEFMALVYELLDSDGTNDRANQIIDAFDSAPEVEAEPVQPNAPLTLEELREIDDPVWVECGITAFTPDGGYYSLCKNGHITTPSGIQHIAEDIPHWKFYRRKPKEETR